MRIGDVHRITGADVAHARQHDQPGGSQPARMLRSSLRSGRYSARAENAEDLTLRASDDLGSRP